MPVVKAKPTSPGRRFVVRVVGEDLYSGKPYSPLVSGARSSGGRNNQGRVTLRHRGGGHKRKYRVIDFKRDKVAIDAVVERIEYDPNRTGHIALVLYKDGERRYILSPKGLKVGDTIRSDFDATVSLGNCMPLRNIPLGALVHSVEMKPRKGGQIARAAGASAQLIAKEGEFASLRLKSGEVRRVSLDCRAVIGEVSNGEHNLGSLGKAGAKRWRGIRPTVRGVAMNPVDHPHGGGEGRTSGGRHPVSPWGVPTKGYKTRNNRRTDGMIVRVRGKK
ncbi:50S ribosomal subunit protein L2 [Gammaproteobacteria bacterium]